MLAADSLLHYIARRSTPLHTSNPRRSGIVNPEVYAPGSLRRGAVTSGVATGMSRAVMRRNLRWRPQTDLFSLYDEPDGVTVRREQRRQAGGTGSARTVKRRRQRARAWSRARGGRS